MRVIALLLFGLSVVGSAFGYVINSAQDIKPGIITNAHITNSSSNTDKLSWTKIANATIPIAKLNMYDPTTISFGGVPMADGSGNIVWTQLGFGQFLPLAGGTMTGSIIPSSTSVNLGSSSNSWGNIWVGNVNASAVSSNSVKIPTIVSAGYLSTDGSGNIIAGPGGTAVGTVTSVAMTVPSWLQISGSPITTNGTLAVSSKTTITANQVLASPDSATGALSTRALVPNDIPVIPGNKVVGGTFGAVNASALTSITGANVTGNIPGNAANITGIAPITNGGTGQTTVTAAFNALSPMNALGDMIYGGTSGSGTRLPGNATSTKKFLTQTGTGTVSAAPNWNTIATTDLPTIQTGGGGTGATSFTANQLVGTGTTSTGPLQTVTVGSGLSLSGGVLTAPATSPSGTIPVGGIIMWSGSSTTIPTGWALCDGSTVSGITTPDLRNRFVQGATADSGTLPHGTAGGSASYTYSGTVSVSGTTGINSDSGTTITTGNNNNAGNVSSVLGLSSGFSGTIVGGATTPGTTGQTISSPVNLAATGSSLYLVQPTHAHSFTVGSHTHSFSGSGSVPTATIPTVPPYYALCFIERVS